MTEAQNIFDQILPRKLTAPVEAEAYCPSNIALSKYWGKRDKALNLPLNSSVSISLAEWGTRTKITPSDADHLIFNGETLSEDSQAAQKLWQFVDLFRRGQDAPLKIETVNSIPTAAGLASSASGFAALTCALDGAFQLGLSDQTKSLLARFGSGSASRSIWHGFVRWNRGTQHDGRDSHGQPLDVVWPEFRIAIVPVDTGPKSHSSRDGMNHTVATSPLFPPWPARAEEDCAAICGAIGERDFVKLGTLAEANALAMHATMLAARPAISYLKPESWAVLYRLWDARANGFQAYATMDAGANVKLLFEVGATDDALSLFPNAQVIAPFCNTGTL